MFNIGSSSEIAKAANEAAADMSKAAWQMRALSSGFTVKAQDLDDARRALVASYAESYNNAAGTLSHLGLKGVRVSLSTMNAGASKYASQTIDWLNSLVDGEIKEQLQAESQKIKDAFDQDEE